MGQNENSGRLEHCAPDLEQHASEYRLHSMVELSSLCFMQDQRAIEILKRKFEETRLKNPRWSLRAFANKIGMSSGALSEIMKGNRDLSMKAREKIAKHLHLSPMEQEQFFAEVLPTHFKRKQLSYHQLSDDQFHLISDWWHFAILNLLKTKDFRGSVNWIAKRLGLSLAVVDEAWNRLLRLGYLKKKDGKIVREYPSINTSDGFFNLSIQKSHLEDAGLIAKSLQEVAVPLRDHTSSTMAMRKSDLKKAKELIRIFQDQFAEKIESEVGDEVYRLSISLFPLTVIEDRVSQAESSS